MNHVNAVCRGVRHKIVHGVEQEIDDYPEENSHIDMVNTDFINSNAKSPGIIAKLKTSSYKPVQIFHIK